MSATYEKNQYGLAGNISIASASGAITGDFCEILCIGSTTFTALTDALERTSAAYGKKASGTITFTGLPVADETIEVNGITYIFKVSAENPDDITIGASATATATNAAAAINAYDAGADVIVTSVAGVVTVTAASGGAGGNSITLAEAASNTAVSGAGTLTGGTNLVAASSLTYASGTVLRGKFTTVHLAGGNARLTVSAPL
jgi:hypothetical protein